MNCGNARNVVPLLALVGMMIMRESWKWEVEVG